MWSVAAFVCARTGKRIAYTFEIVHIAPRASGVTIIKGAVTANDGDDDSHPGNTLTLAIGCDHRRVLATVRKSIALSAMRVFSPVVATIRDQTNLSVIISMGIIHRRCDGTSGHHSDVRQSVMKDELDWLNDVRGRSACCVGNPHVLVRLNGASRT